MRRTSPAAARFAAPSGCVTDLPVADSTLLDDVIDRGGTPVAARTSRAAQTSHIRRSATPAWVMTTYRSPRGPHGRMRYQPACVTSPSRSLRLWDASPKPSTREPPATTGYPSNRSAGQSPRSAGITPGRGAPCQGRGEPRSLCHGLLRRPPISKPIAEPRLNTGSGLRPGRARSVRTDSISLASLGQGEVRLLACS